jgi:hypothetical protein
MKTKMNNLIKVLTPVLLVLGISIAIACSPNSTSIPENPREITIGPAEGSESSQGATSPPAAAAQPVKEPPAVHNVDVVIAGYLNHGPMQPTIRAIKDILAKYEDNVAVTWIDLGTQEGAAYFKQNNLTAHMNVIINGTYEYNVNGKHIEFQWFEGTQWTKQDLDAVLSNLINQ